jgi:hypothetical protein
MTDEHHADRRSFLRTGAIAGTALVAGASAMAQQVAADTDASNRPLTKGDIAILRLLAAVELIESDLWLQYAELGGVQDSELPGLTGGSAAYTAALNVLDGDMSQYTLPFNRPSEPSTLNRSTQSRTMHPIAHNLQPDTADPGRIGAWAAIIDLRKCQKTAGLIGIA